MGRAAPLVDFDRAWYVARIHPGWGQRSRQDLEQLEVNWALPRHSEIVIRRNRRVVRSTPMLPATVFIGVRDDAHLKQVEGVRGVAGILSYAVPVETNGNVPEIANRPVRIDPEILSTFLARVAANEIVQPTGVGPGQVVTIVEGPFASFPGLVEVLLPSERVRVSVAIFGRKSIIDLRLADVAIL